MSRRRPHRRRAASDRGSSDALGLALLAPAAIGLALVVLFLGRSVDGRATALSAAESAAQAAAQERTPDAAHAAARRVADAMLVDGTTCARPAVSLDTSQFRPGGVVTVSVTCSVSTTGFEAIGAPARSFTAVAHATIDPLRESEARS